MTTPESGAQLIAAERQRQIEVEGWTPYHDDKHKRAALSDAATEYLMLSANQVRYGGPFLSTRTRRPGPWWPWDSRWWNPSDDPVRNLIKAGALIAAEIDRIQRANGAARD